MICHQEDLGELRKENGKFRIHNKKSVLRSFVTLAMTLPYFFSKTKKCWIFMNCPFCTSLNPFAESSLVT